MSDIQKTTATEPNGDGFADSLWATTSNIYVTTALLDLPDTSIPIIKEVWKPRSTWAGISSRLRPQSRTLRHVVESAALSNGSEKKVPSSVLLELPESIFAHDRRTGGHLNAAMAVELAKLHQEDLGAMMPNGAQARYKVIAATDLPINKMRVRMGPAIYVPKADEQPAWRVELSLDGVDWGSMQPLFIYEDQSLFILSGSVNHGSYVYPDWPFPSHIGLVMLNLPGQHSLDLSAEPLRSLETLHNTQGGWTVVREPGCATDGACLYLKTTRLQPETKAIDAQKLIIEEETEGVALPGSFDFKDAHIQEPIISQNDFIDDALTIPQSPPASTNLDDDIDDAPTIPQLPPTPPNLGARLELCGLALQRLTLYSGVGVEGLRWAFDAQGRMVRVDTSTAQLKFELTSNDELQLLTRSGHRKLVHGEALPLKAGSAASHFRKLPQALEPNYIGWLSLLDCPSITLFEGKEFKVGRWHTDTIDLRPLARVGLVLGQSSDMADRLDFSRDHAILCLSAKGLMVKTIEQAKVAHLDSEMNFLGWVNGNKETLIEPGHHLLLSHYLWRLKS